MKQLPLDNGPLVSVVIPAYQAEDYLECCLDSVMAQTYVNTEVIIVNDASTDKTSSIAEKFSLSYPSVKLINKTKNSGLNRARQTGVDNCEGEYVFFVACEDMVLPDLISELVFLSETHETEISVCACQHFFSESDIVHLQGTSNAFVYDHDEVIYHYLTDNHFWPHSSCRLDNAHNKLIRRNLFCQMDWDTCDYSVGEDDFFTPLLLTLASKVAISEKGLYCCRESNPNAIAAQSTREFKFNGKKYSVFRQCQDYYVMLQSTFGEEFQSEILFRSYLMFRHHVWSMAEVNYTLTLEDINEFDEFFPLEDIEKGCKHELEKPFIDSVKRGGLFAWVLFVLENSNNELSIEKRLRAELEADKSYTMSIKGSLRRFLGNVKRRISGEFNGFAREISVRQSYRKTKKECSKILSRLKPVYDNQETRIPKIIHYCWVGGNKKPDDVIKYIASWEKYLPEYEIIEWNESNFNLDQYRYAREAYDSKKWAFVSDVVRLHALFEYGGIYLDSDVEVLKSLDSFLNHRSFSGFEVLTENNPEPFIPTGLMGSERNGQWVSELLAEYETRNFIMQDGSFDITPNPRPITRHTVEKYNLKRNNMFQDLGAVAIYPGDYFCAKSYLTRELTITENTHAIHHFAGSWL